MAAAAGNVECIYNFAFTGFTAFGKIKNENKSANYEFTETNIRISQPVEDILIADGWSYMAFAYGSTLILQGLFNCKPNQIVERNCECAIKQIVANKKFCLVLLENGKLLKMDIENDMEMKEIRFERSNQTKRDIFGVRKVLQPFKIKNVALGDTLAVAISSTNDVFNIPSKVHQFPKNFEVKDLQCGAEHALLLNTNGDVYSWGNGLKGQLGSDSVHILECPTLIDALAGVKITCIAAGGWNSAAISVYNDVYLWGFNSNGQLAKVISNPAFKLRSVCVLPTLTELLECNSNCSSAAVDSDMSSTCRSIKIFAGFRHLIIQMSCGKLFGCGWNGHGQLGLGRCLANVEEFKQIKLPNSSFLNGDIICGRWTTIIKPKNNNTKIIEAIQETEEDVKDEIPEKQREVC